MTRVRGRPIVGPRVAEAAGIGRSCSVVVRAARAVARVDQLALFAPLSTRLALEDRPGRDHVGTEIVTRRP